MRNPIATHQAIARPAGPEPPHYAHASDYRRTDAPRLGLPPGPGERPLAGGGQPLAMVRRALHYSGRRAAAPKRRRVHAFALLYIKRGRGELIVNNRSIAVNGRQLFLFFPGMHVIEQADAQADWDVYYIAFKLLRPVRAGGGWALEAFDRPPFPHGGELQASDLPAVERLIERLCEDGGPDDGMLRWKRQTLLAELLYTITAEQLTQRRQPSAEDAIRRCAAYIDQHYTEPIRIDGLAAWCGLHPSTFSRHFKQTIGMLPSEYVIHVRIEAAKLLLPGSGPLREVARRVGFCDEYYFSRMFKKVAGVSPSVYTRTAGSQAQDRQRNGRVLQPVNVAVTYVDEVDHLIALGLLPAAVPADHLPDGRETTIPYLKPYIAHLPHIGCEQSIDLELLRKLHPELIIACTYMQHWGVTRLTDIAPTHAYRWEMDWRNVHRQLAEVLGQEARAEQNIAQFDQLVRVARDRMLPACAGRTFVFLESTREGVRVSPYMSNGGWLLYQLLGLPPAPIVSVNGWTHIVAPEEAAAIDADYVFVGQRSGALGVHDALLREPGIRRRRSRVIELPRYPWGKGGPLAYTQGVRLMLTLFAKLHK
ncbi:helix-turn-helix domain-containing protein [Paenibacillus sp. IB182496]|uniref:Helix-turn-helix domain-containing protein n=1 Tax=Paenibacillus sabuli TaxID=2772509 RepID=A0A927GR15_9BACL|nr:helix-turn-helix domain-containing protein [Paenibacillus sabuli]MBD2844846.1 helix-turn-helix domain-containing protein [Paenibacillus sabuli]